MKTKSDERRDVMRDLYFRWDDRINKELTKEELKKRMKIEDITARSYLDYMRNEDFNIETVYDDFRDYRDMIQVLLGHVYLSKDIIREFKDVFNFEELKLYISLNYPSIIDIFKYNMKQFDEADIGVKFIVEDGCCCRVKKLRLNRFNTVIIED